MVGNLRNLRGLAVALALSAPAAGEAPRLDQVEHLRVEDGLAHSTVWDLLQDRHGFLWFATVNALQRYDGYSFETYQHDPEDPDSIASSEVMKMIEDRDGQLWLATRQGGLDRLDRAGDRFVHHRHDPADPRSLTAGPLWTLIEDSGGFLWTGGTGGLNRLDPTTGGVTRFVYDPSDPTSLGSGEVLALAEDREGTLWVGTSSGLARMEPETGSFTHFRHDPTDPGSLSAGSVNTIFEGRAGALWIGTEAGLDRLDRDSGSFVHTLGAVAALGRDVEVASLFEDGSGGLWVATFDAGLFYLESGSRAGGVSGSTWRHYRFEADNAHGLSENEVFDIEEDRTGILWIATRAGVDKVDRRKERFEVFRHRPGSSRGLVGRRAWGIVEDRQGVLWIGTNDNGLSAVDRTAGTFTHYQPEPGEANRLVDARVTAVLEDRAGELWIGTEAGLSRLDAQRQTFTTYRHEHGVPGAMTSNNVYSLLEDRSGRLWIGYAGSGVQRLEQASPARFISYRHDSKDPGSLSSDNIYSIYEDRGGELWVTTDAGLNLFRVSAGSPEGTREQSFEHFSHQPGDPNSLSNDEVSVIYQATSGVYWIGTIGGGLDRWHRQRDEFRNYRSRDGLADDKVVGILEDDAGRLWLSTSRGLSRFDPRTEAFRNYGPSDGIHGTTFYIGSSHRGRGGELFFGGPGGLTAFHPDRLEDDPDPPQVVLTDFLLAGQPAPVARQDPDSPLETAITESRALVLDHRHNIFAFEIAALHYGDPRRNRYAYRLEGFEERWIETGAEHRRAQYTNLDAGRYTFRAKASNRHGVWNEDGVSVQVTVLPPPWKSWWAYSLYGLALAGVVLAYLHTQRRKLDRERRAAEQERAVAERERAANLRLQETDRLKDEFLANTSHELRTPLHGITGLAESLIDGGAGPVPEAVQANLSLIVTSGRRLGHLVNDILDFSKLRHRNLELDLRRVDLRPLVEVVLTLSRPLVGSKPLELRNAVPEDLPAVAADENRLQQIFHNLVGNAVKFTESGSVEISAEADPSLVKVRVTDTGPGIAPDQQERIFGAFEQGDASERPLGGTGLGLAVSRQLVELHGGTIGVESTPGAGATFELTLPVAGDELPAAGGATGEVTDAAVPVADAFLAQVDADAGSLQTASAGAELHEGARILVVDDEPINRQVLKNFLSVENFDLTLASSGDEALRLLESQTFDLVLLDIMMPRLSGYEVCRTLRQQHPLGELPVIFLTAKNQDSDVVTGMSLGANDFLTKPISKDRLLARVRPHLDLLKTHRNLERLVEQKISQIKVLRGMLPICSSCKKIRDDAGYWSDLEVFIDQHSEAEFTHSLCPSCTEEYFRQLDGSSADSG